jgi:ATP-dependent DNA helicase RecG
LNFDDRIELFNPGRLMEGLSIEKLVRGNYISAIRNKQIATIFKEAGIIEKYGSGIKRILEATRAYGLPEPKIEEIQNGFRVTLFRTTQKTTQKMSTRDHILEALRVNPKMTREELAQMLGRSPNTIKEHLTKLKEGKRLKRVGSDRDGYWEVH